MQKRRIVNKKARLISDEWSDCLLNEGRNKCRPVKPMVFMLEIYLKKYKKIK